jgi:hypothetical protein
MKEFTQALDALLDACGDVPVRSIGKDTPPRGLRALSPAIQIQCRLPIAPSRVAGLRRPVRFPAACARSLVAGLGNSLLVLSRKCAPVLAEKICGQLLARGRVRACARVCAELDAGRERGGQVRSEGEACSRGRAVPWAGAVGGEGRGTGGNGRGYRCGRPFRLSGQDNAGPFTDEVTTRYARPRTVSDIRCPCAGGVTPLPRSGTAHGHSGASWVGHGDEAVHERGLSHLRQADSARRSRGTVRR